MRAGWAVVVIVSAAGAVSGWWRGLGERPDWRDFRAESRYVWEQRRSAPGTAMFGYLPGAAVLLWPFAAWTPNGVGVALFVATNVACAVAVIWILAHCWTRRARPFPMSAALPAAMVLGCANLAHALQSNQMTLWTLALIVAGLALVGRGRQGAGGLMLGAAAAIKTMPLLLGAYLVLTRRWRATGMMVVGFLLVDVVPSLVAYGPAGTPREHRDWLRRVAWHSNGVQIEDPLLRVHRHGSNQSFSAVLARWLRDRPNAETQVIVKGDAPEGEVERLRAALGRGEVLSIDPMPPRDADWELLRKDISRVPRFHVASLSPTAVKTIWAVALIAALAALSIATWRTRGMSFDGDWTPAAALWMLAMFWPSPMMRDYYLVWALPALLVVCRGLTAAIAGGGGRWTPGMRLAAAAIWMWIIGLAGLAVDVAMWYGVHLLALAVLAAATAWAWRREQCAGPAMARST
jgi:hypothetical protein